MTRINQRLKQGLRRVAVLALLLVILNSMLCTARASQYPTTWDLGQIYASTDEWYADFERVEQLIQGHAEYRGQLDDAATIAEYIDRFYMGELTQLQTRLYLYATLGNNLDPTDATYTELLALLAQQTSEEKQLSAYVEPELAALPYEQRVQLFNDPLLSEYKYAFSDLLEEDCTVLSEAEAGVLAALEPSQGRASEVYTILANLELPAPRVVMPDGSERELDAALYGQVFYGGEYDREFQLECYDAAAAVYGDYAGTFAALLDSCASENWALARINGYDSTRQASLAADGVDERVYDMVISAARSGADEFQRFIRAHGRGLGLDVQYPFELSASFTEYDPGLLNYDDAVGQVRDALSLLGEGYMSIVDAIVNGNQIDVYPSATKPYGSFTLTLGDEYLPYIMLNYTGTTDDACTLAHELGHAVYGRKSALAQNELYETASLLTQETAAMVNELLFCQARISDAGSDSERLYYIEYALNAFSNALFIQAMYAEFEEQIYDTIEAGGALDAETLGDSWSALHTDYYGDAIEFGEHNRYLWASLPHLYYNHYVYSYAVSVCCAAALCDGLRDGDDAALEAYGELLNAGSSASPVELLAQAGADPLAQSTYDEALEYFSALVDEYERLIDAGVR